MAVTIHRLVLSYGIAAAGVVLAGLSHWWLAPLIGDSPPVRLLLVVVVMASAWIGGLGPGLFATGLGLLAIVAANDAPADLGSLLTRLVRFGSLGLLITVLFKGLHAARHRAELKDQEYRRSEGRYRRLVETAGEGIWAFDLDGRTTYANPRLGEMLGAPPGELIGRQLSEFLAGDEDAPPTWSDVATGAPTCQEVRLLGSDGAVRNAVVTTRPIGPDEVPGGPLPSKEGMTGGSLLMVTDVTDLRRAEVALREKESVLRSFYESSVMAMGVIEQTEDDTRFISANALTDTFFGLTPGKLEGRTAKELRAPPEMMAVWIERFRQCRATGRPIRFEYQAVCPTSPKWVAATLSPMGTSGSGRALCSFIVEDITDRKRTEEDLRDAKELAEAACQAKDRFLAVLSHELRTPLTPVLIAVSSMLESNPGLAVLPILEMIHRNIELEARLIDDLLDLSRFSRGELRLDLEMIDIHEPIRRAIEICRDETRVAGLDVVTELDAAHHHVTADHARVMQIVWNLIRNAAKFTPPGGRLTIRTTNPPESSSTAQGHPHRLVVDFEDTGIGIDPEVLPRIFEAFERGHDDVRGRSGGLGLGLAIGRSIAEALGGRLTASSRGSGLGSTFRLELTTVSAPALPAGAGSGTAPPTSPSAPLRRSDLRILLVEDNKDTLRFLATVLRQRGHDVVTADRVATARAAVVEAKVPFDLLLSDIELPDGDGLFLMRELSASGNMLGIAVSGFGAEEDLRQSREAGFFDHLIKPVDLGRLEAAIRRAASRSTEKGISSITVR
ncbi:MAG: PAS domain S-box protein [Isosphaerales bacterium]